jgi:hypothetical protein
MWSDPGLAGSPALLSLRNGASITVTGSKRIGLFLHCKPPFAMCRRHRNSTFGLTPLACATFATDAPGSGVCSTIRPFSSTG